MSWLVAHMWIALAGAGLVALLLGWSVRGALLTGRLRKAEVDRDLARVELDEARDEIEKLFAAQRKLGGVQGVQPAIPAQADPALQQKLAETAQALVAAEAELAALKSAPAAVAPLPMVTLPDDGAARRIEELEGQLKGLDAELARTRDALAAAEAGRVEAVAAAQSAAAAVADAQAASQAASQAAAPAAPAAPEADAKLAWEVSYLRARAQALEAELAAAPVAVQAAVPAAVAAPEPEAKPVAAAAADDPVEEELARLRWRNRYLEGRLAYFEGDAQSIAEEMADAADAPEGASVPEPAAAPEVAAPAQPAIEPQRPMSLDGPMAHPADDLTLIGGIGPKIQEVLNTLGIWHYDQIAEWTPENVAWIDDYLNFNGRVSREGWVEQAAVLVGEGAET